MERLLAEPAHVLLTRLRQGEVTAAALVDAHLARIHAVNPSLNAVVQLAADRARAEAEALDRERAAGRLRGVLHGLPITIKDSHDTAGLITTWGTEGRASTIPERDSTAVARLRAAGAIVLGKTNTPELTLSFSTDNRVYGRTENPWRIGRSAGGSSGGAAAILAAGGSALDIGSDLGGSIRVPAHFCGVAGIKPTAGRVPRTGHALPFGGPLDAFGTIGPMARSARDLGLALSVLAGPDGVDPSIPPVVLGSPDDVRIEGLRVAGLIATDLERAGPACSDAVREALARLADAGAQVVDPPKLALSEAWCLATLSLFVHLGPTVRRIFATWGTRAPHRFLAPEAGGEDGVPGMLRLIAQVAGAIPVGAYLQRLAARDPEQPFGVADVDDLAWAVAEARSGLVQALSSVDALLLPVSTGPAPTHAEVEQRTFPFGNPINLAGVPSVAVPVSATAGGLPIGVQVLAAPWRDDLALAVGAAIEAPPGHPALTHPLPRALLVVCGPGRMGRTAAARRLCAATGAELVVVDEGAPSRRQASRRAERLLGRDRSVVLDDAAWSRGARDEWRQLAARCDAILRLVVVRSEQRRAFDWPTPAEPHVALTEDRLASPTPLWLDEVLR